jgi:hypothetical protein
MASGSLQEKILPAGVINTINEEANDLEEADVTNAAKSLITKTLDGAKDFINSNHFIVWVIILISTFMYNIFTGLRGNLTEMFFELFNNEMLFSLFVISNIYAWSDYMPNVLKLSSKKIMFIPYRNNRNSREQFSNIQPNQRFGNKQPYRRKLEIY